jgi:hypothetical protein
MPIRQALTITALALVAFGCTTTSAERTADIEVSPAEGNMCFKQLGTAYEWQGLQLESTGEADLVVTNIEVRGDASCAFQCFREAADGEALDQLYPCPQESEGSAGFTMTLAPGELRFVRVVFRPSAAGVTDFASLVITSDAESHLAEGAQLGQLEVPLCGTGFEEGDLPDGGVDPDGGADCPECATIEPGAVGCTDGYPEQ